MFYLDILFEWLSSGLIGSITNGVIPLTVWGLITVLLYFTARWFAQRFGNTKQVGKYILRGCRWIAGIALFVSIFTSAYGYRGTAIDTTHENISLIDPGLYEIVANIPIDEGHMFVIRNQNDSVTTKNNTKTVYCKDWQAKTSLATGSVISAVGYERVFIFIDAVEIPSAEDLAPAEDKSWWSSLFDGSGSDETADDS